VGTNGMEHKGEISLNVKLVFHYTSFSGNLFPLERACTVNPEGWHVLFFEDFVCNLWQLLIFYT